ncbi:restriction endonuclease [[Clostridium] scindens]|uniref:restriction endonuclease n=1 Tax=Clostridium scindens (strain JCM 10418 / VPI 12708) TaxID=29347 RepID=UPI0030291508|nr:restriction endonuclease [Lachnospiraceae bacterium]
MTIVEAIKIVMEKHPQGITNKEAYEEIVRLSLYKFAGKNPSAIVNGIIRRHCYGLDFPTANPVKHFKIIGYRGKKALYALANIDEINSKSLNKKIVSEELLPEEKIQKYYNEHLENIYSQLIDNIMENMPVFFERLIVDLLLKMGYGYDDHSGIVVGGSHDNGIDGVINEDKLGLSLIYLQAKRYAQKNKVGRPEIQSFVGAMQNIQKGVFITTSSFSREAKEFAEHQQQKNLKLIDGEMLTHLMVKYEVGIVSQQSLKIYKVDNSYFE